MKTLILYLSNDGQTKKIADAIAKEHCYETKVVSLEEFKEGLNQFDNIVIGASIRYGHFNKKLYKFIKNNTDTLNSKNASFYGVNLTARKADKNTPETNVYVRKFLAKINWKPKQAAVFAGALFYPRYNFFDKRMIQFIMKLTGGETDTSKEVEYTDWQKVKEFAQKL